MGRVVPGGLLAGVVVFCWGAAAHMALPLGTIGVHKLPNEDEVLTQDRRHGAESSHRQTERIGRLVKMHATNART